MCFCPSFMRATYSARLVRRPPDLEDWKRSSGSRRRLQRQAGCGRGHMGAGAGAWVQDGARAVQAAGGGRATATQAAARAPLPRPCTHPPTHPPIAGVLNDAHLQRLAKRVPELFILASRLLRGCRWSRPRRGRLGGGRRHKRAAWHAHPPLPASCPPPAGACTHPPPAASPPRSAPWRPHPPSSLLGGDAWWAGVQGWENGWFGVRHAQPPSTLLLNSGSSRTATTLSAHTPLAPLAPAHRPPPCAPPPAAPLPWRRRLPPS